MFPVETDEIGASMSEPAAFENRYHFVAEKGIRLVGVSATSVRGVGSLPRVTAYLNRTTFRVATK
jgi:hypothetical protein